MRDYVIGIDVGGTKIAGALVEQNGACSSMYILPTPTGAADILHAIAELIRTFDLTDVRAVGIGTAGQVDVEQGIISHAVDTIPGWTGTRMRDVLRHSCNLPIIIDNDVNAMAIGEMRFGAGRGIDHALYVAIGTGIGGAMIHHGALWRGVHWSAGELGHLMVDWQSDRRCPCGETGHLEAYVTGPAIASAYYRQIGHSETSDLRPVVEAAQQGDETATAVLIESAEILGKTLAGLVCAFDPQAVILGGGVVDGLSDTPFWWHSFETNFRAGKMPAPRKTELRFAKLRTNAALIGAACLAWDLLV